MPVTQSPLDSRDIPYVPRPIVHGAYDLRIDDSVIEDQGNEASCTAHAATSACEILMGRNMDFNQLSRHFPYFYARDRAREGQQGCPLREVLHTLKHRGCCYEQDWPFIPQNRDIEPPREVTTKALQVGQIVRYERLMGSGTQLLEAIKSSISEGFPVVFVMRTTMPFMMLRGSFVDQHTKTPYRGSAAGYPLLDDHAMCIVGYSGNRLIIKNSWGTGWGDNGYGLIQPEAVGDILEAWCIKGFSKGGVDLSPISAWLTTKTDSDIDMMFLRLIEKNPRYWALHGLSKRNGGGRAGFQRMADILGFTRMNELNQWVFSI